MRVGYIIFFIGLGLLGVSAGLNYKIFASFLLIGILLLLGILLMLAFAFALGYRFKPSSYWQKVGEDEYYEYYEKRTVTPLQKKINAIIGVLFVYFMAYFILGGMLVGYEMVPKELTSQILWGPILGCVGIIIGGFGLKKTIKRPQRVSK